MRCTEIEILLSDYADGLANARARRIVERHFQLCANCYAGAMKARKLGQQLQRLSLLPEGIVERAPRLRRSLEQNLARRGRLFGGAFASRVALVLAVVVLCVLLSALVLAGR